MFRISALTLLIGAVFFITFQRGSFVAGGSDSACYAIQAVRWSQVLRHPLTASLQTPDPLALAAPWPDAAATFAPTGHVASPTVRGAFVPICPAGLSIAMAPLYLAGGPPLMFAIVPLFGVGLVLATYALGTRFNVRVGVAAAALIAASPAFLYQVVQPMSDVPAAALWVAAVACATGTKRNHATLAGLATSGAVLMRPNLVPLGFAIGLYLLARPERPSAARLRAALTYAAWSAPGCILVALIQSPPLRFAVLVRVWLARRDLRGVARHAQSATLCGLVVAHADARDRARPAGAAGAPGCGDQPAAGGGVINLVLFLPYLVFDDWSYLRFLLPAIPLLLVLVAAVVDSLLVRLPVRECRLARDK